MLQLSYGVAAVLVGLGGWLMAAGGGLWTWTAWAAGLVAVGALAMAATLPARLRRVAWRTTAHAPKELLVFAEGLLLSRDATQLRMPWSEFTGMDETPRLLLLKSGAHRSVFVVPKRGLGDPAAVPRLRESFAARVGPRTTRAGAGIKRAASDLGLHPGRRSASMYTTASSIALVFAHDRLPAQALTGK